MDVPTGIQQARPLDGNGRLGAVNVMPLSGSIVKLRSKNEL